MIRKYRKWFAWLLFGLAVLLALPPGINLFFIDDFVMNIPLASWLAMNFGFQLGTALLLTYTLLPFLLLLLSIGAYPAKNDYIAKKFARIIAEKIKAIIRKGRKNPLIWVGIIIMIIITFKLLKIYQKYLVK